MMQVNYQKKISQLVLLLTAFTFLFLVLYPVKADAAIFARAEYFGYFNNNEDCTGIQLDPSGIEYINTIDELVTYYRSGVNSSNNQVNTTASFTVLHMLGVAPGASKITSSTDSRFVNWENKVRAYADAGYIQWDVNYSYTENTFYQNSAHNSSWSCSSNANNNDVAWYEDSDSSASIVFTHEDGTDFAIKKDCANPVGETSPLKDLTKNWNYEHWTFGIERNSGSGWSNAASGTPQYGRDTSIRAKNRIQNTGDGAGSSYSHNIEYSVDGGGWANIYAVVHGPIGAGGSHPTRISNAVNLGDLGAENGEQVCFRGRINNYTGTNTGGSTSVTSSGNLFSSVLCVVVYDPPPTIGGFNVNCARARYTNITTANGQNATVRLYVDGAAYGSSQTVSSGGSGEFTNERLDWIDFRSHSYYIVITDSYGNSRTSATRTQDGDACIDFECNTMTISPSPIESGNTFRVRASFSFAGGANNFGSQGTAEPLRIDIQKTSGPSTTPEYGSWTGIGSLTASDSTSISFSRQSPNITANDSGAVEFRSRLHFVSNTRSSGQNIVCSSGAGTDSGDIVNRPFFKQFSGDIAAGTTSACWLGYQNGARTIGFNRSNADRRGSAVQLAAYALGLNYGFDSDMSRWPGAAFGLNNKNLSFANTVGGQGGNFGGGFCPPESFSYDNMPSSGVSNLVGPPDRDISGLNGTYHRNAPLRISGNLSAGQRVTLYVDGDVRINSNIVGPDTWADENDIALLTIIARGNIYVDDDVTQIEGIFIAQDDDLLSNPAGHLDKGQIYTCAQPLNNNAFAPPPDERRVAEECNNQLIVYGSFMAKNINLLRSNGTRNDDDVESRFNITGVSPRYQANYYSTYNTAAEVFIFSPEFWLATPPYIPPASNASYDSIKSLPPVL